jgi:hypothetical protein
MSAIRLFDTLLHCPECGGENLHHGTVEVFNRRVEDMPSMAVLIPDDGGPRTGDPSRNPSSRRNGIAIGFWCEACGDDRGGEMHTLNIYQHKGSTYIEWDEDLALFR